jgi:putative membrane protein
MIIWALIALIVQIGVFMMLRILFSHLIEDIAQDHIGPAVLMAFVSVAAGLINAASMTY